MAVQLGAQSIDLRPPPSFAARSDVVYARFTNERRAYAAALGLCWPPGADGNPNRAANYRGDVMAYGGGIIDELKRRGISGREIHAAGLVAYALCAADVLEEWEVSEAVGNSAAKEDGGA